MSFAVKEIRGWRRAKNGEREFMVKWKHYEEESWWPEKKLGNARRLIDAYLSEQKLPLSEKGEGSQQTKTEKKSSPPSNTNSTVSSAKKVETKTKKAEEQPPKNVEEKTKKASEKKRKVEAEPKKASNQVENARAGKKRRVEAPASSSGTESQSSTKKRSLAAAQQDGAGPSSQAVSSPPTAPITGERAPIKWCPSCGKPFKEKRKVRHCFYCRLDVVGHVEALYAAEAAKKQ